MFRKLDVAKLDQTKSSVARGIRGKIAEQFPQLEDEEVLDELIPKKCTMNIAKTDQKVNIVVVDGVPMFFQLRDGPYFPTLKLLHKYPDCMPKLRVDKGAIKFVFGGANIMCPGLTSPGAVMHDDVPEDTPSPFTPRGRSTRWRWGIHQDEHRRLGEEQGRRRGHHPPPRRRAVDERHDRLRHGTTSSGRGSWRYHHESSIPNPAATCVSAPPNICLRLTRRVEYSLAIFHRGGRRVEPPVPSPCCFFPHEIGTYLCLIMCA